MKAFGKRLQAVRARVLDRAAPVPAQALRSFSVRPLGWGPRFEEVVGDCLQHRLESIDLFFAGYASGEQTWMATVWDGDDAEMPSADGSGKTPDVALNQALERFRTKSLTRGSTTVWRRSSP